MPSDGRRRPFEVMLIHSIGSSHRLKLGKSRCTSRHGVPQTRRGHRVPGSRFRLILPDGLTTICTMKPTIPLGLVIVLLIFRTVAIAQEKPAADEKDKAAYPVTGGTKNKLPAYPRVDLATVYEVDPNWPQRPSGVQTGETPGVAVDKDDNVYVFVRAKPPVQVYSAEGKFLRSWGSDFVKRAHHIKIDPNDGSIWIADVGAHVV